MKQKRGTHRVFTSPAAAMCLLKHARERSLYLTRISRWYHANISLLLSNNIISNYISITGFFGFGNLTSVNLYSQYSLRKNYKNKNHNSNNIWKNHRKLLINRMQLRQIKHISSARFYSFLFSNLTIFLHIPRPAFIDSTTSFEKPIWKQFQILVSVWFEEFLLPTASHGHWFAAIFNCIFLLVYEAVV